MLADRSRFALYVVLWLVLWLLPQTPSRAASMVHHDLTSLALESDAIVLARVTSVREIDRYTQLHTHEVVESYFGELAPGDVIELDYGALALVPMWEKEDFWTPDDEVVLFLQRRDRGDGSWRLVDSGLRIFVDGLTYRFEQFDNPGPYRPVPQGDDPYDVFEDPRGREPLTRAAFEPELRAAIEGAAVVRRDLAAIDSPDARARLLDAIGPAWGHDDAEPCVISGDSRFEDRVAVTILERLWVADETEAALEGYSRIRGGVDTWRLQANPKASWMLARASERERPIHQRVAALRWLAADWSMQRKPGVADSLVPLLADPEPSIRAAAAMSLDAKATTASWRAAIVERLRVESDTHARYALAVAAIDHELLDGVELPPESWPMATAERCGRALELRWISPGVRWNIETLTVTARPAQAQPQSLRLVPGGEIASWSMGRTAGLRLWLLFEAPLPDGRVDLELVAVLRQGEQTREFRWSLRPLGVPPAVPLGQPAAAIEATPVPAGCACTATTSATPSVAWSLLLLVGLAAQRRMQRDRQ